VSCPFCGIAAARSELVIATNEHWVLLHVDRLFNPGSLFLVTRDHLLTPQITAEVWAEAAPLLAEGTRLLTEVGGAERVYLASFSEMIKHFHMTFLCVRPDDPAAYGGRRGPALLDAIARSETECDPAAAALWVGRYRAALRPLAVTKR
jgi:hypothetical protein